MVERSSRHGWGLALAVAMLCAAAVAAPEAAEAIDLTVQGRSDLSIRARSAGAELVADGRLRDDRGRPLARRRVALRVTRGSGDDLVAEEAVDTDERGRFRADFDVDPGTYRVEAVFEATTHVEGHRVEETVEVEPEPVELRVEGPQVVGTGVSTVDVRVRATAAGRGVGVPVGLEANGQRWRRELSPRGSGEFDVRGLLAPGDNRLTAVVPATEYRDRATANHALRLVDEPKLEARASTVFERLQRGIVVEVTVTDAHGPVEGMAVDAGLTRVAGRSGGGGGDDGESSSRSEEPTKSGETDANGRFRAFFGREDLTDGTWRGEVTASPELGQSVTSRLEPVELDRTVSRYVVRGAAGLALLAVLLVVGREAWSVARRRLRERRERLEEERRREEAFEETEGLEPTALDEIPEEAEPTASDDEARTVSGVVWDVWREEAVGGAEVRATPAGADEPSREATTDERGWFELGELESGSWELAVDAEGFVRADSEFEVPHDGTLATARFDVVAVPLKIRRLYRSLASIVEEHDPWGELSPREIRDAIVGVLEARGVGGSEERPSIFARRVEKLVREGEDDLESGGDYVRALTDIVEETNFSRRRYGRETWELARRLALRIRELVEGGHDD